MDGGLAADVRQRAGRVPPGIGPQPARQRRKHGVAFPGDLGPSGKAVQGVGFDIAPGPRPFGSELPNLKHSASVNMARISFGAMSCCSDFEYRVTKITSLDSISGEIARDQRINDGLDIRANPAILFCKLADSNSHYEPKCR